MKSLRQLVVGGVAVASAVALMTACSSSKSSNASTSTPASSATTGTSTSSLASLLPSKYRTAGKLVLGTQYPFPPFDFVASNGKLSGLEIDLANAIGTELNIPISVVNSSFSALIPGLISKRYDLYMNDVAITSSRLSQISFVSELDPIEGNIVAAGNPKHVTPDPISFCGLTTSLVSGSTQLPALQGYSDACVKAGKAKLTILTTDSDADAILAVQSGRSDFQTENLATANYTASQSNGKLSAVAFPSGGGGAYLTGIAIRKDDTQLLTAVAAALNALIKSGQYAKILAKYGATPFAIPTAKVVTASSPS